MILDYFAGASKGFFDSSVGSEFANRSAEYKKTAPKPSAPRRASSGGGFFDKSVGSEFANRSESPKKAAPSRPAPTRSSAGKFYIVTLPFSQLVLATSCASINTL